jgi:predicted  nucleic acid-binding Zn-ribbon protein
MQQLEAKLAEKHIRDANEELSEKVKALEIVKKQITNKEGTLNHKKGELDKIIHETEKEEKHYNDISDAARKGMDERLLYSYDRIRKSYRNGLAVVPVIRDACGGCYNSIPPQKQSEIRQRKKVMICENCGRILVDDELNNSTEVQ